MSAQFATLASGSGGNAAWLRTEAYGLLLDFGLGPRLLASRLAAIGASWRHVHAALLTHTHSDHWKDRTLAHLRSLRQPLYCHADHVPILQRYSPAYTLLERDGLVRHYEAGEAFTPVPGVRVWAEPVPHDSGPTFAFRIEGGAGLFGPTWSVGWATDLGVWSEALADHLAGVDLLAIEFNHDLLMERGSRRPAELIARVLSEQGHLSNIQAADLLTAVLARPGAETLRHLVQLHLSRDCNRPELAVSAARTVLGARLEQVRIHTAQQDQVGSIISLGYDRPSARRGRAARPRLTPRPLLPGWEGTA